VLLNIQSFPMSLSNHLFYKNYGSLLQLKQVWMFVNQVLSSVKDDIFIYIPMKRQEKPE